MGFFSDLKDDLSQAVNELMPEEELEAALAAQAAAEDKSSAENVIQEETPKAQDTLETVDLDSMLNKLEEAAPAVEMPAEPEAAAIPEPVMEMPAAEPEPVIEEVPEAEPQPAAVIEEAPAEEAVIEEPAVEPEMETEPEEDKQTIQNSGGEKKKMEVQANRVAVDETAVVTEGMTITGDIMSEGSMELIGTVNGNIGRSTGVIGNISATSAVVAGAVNGDIDVQGPVILDTTAIVMGNIKSKSVQINNGAVIEGMCSQCYADVNPTSFFEEFKKKK